MGRGEIVAGGRGASFSRRRLWRVEAPSGRDPMRTGWPKTSPILIVAGRVAGRVAGAAARERKVRETNEGGSVS
jgi:hypothetical protein